MRRPTQCESTGRLGWAAVDWVLELAENANTYTPLGPDDERIVNDRFVLWMGRGDEPAWNVAQRFRLHADEVVYLAYIDGKPVARASGSFGEHGVTLFGGATLPEARGRGAYRALVAARWEDAVARETPILVTQAGPMSRPILAELGFREVCEIRILLDLFDR